MRVSRRLGRFQPGIVEEGLVRHGSRNRTGTTGQKIQFRASEFDLATDAGQGQR
jgi:hypothetical protein